MKALLRRGRGRLGRDVKGALAIYVASRLAVLVIFVFAGLVKPGLDLRQTFLRRDSGWFVSVIGDWYPAALPMEGGEVAQNNVAFFPGYPMIAKGVHEVTGLSPVVAAALTSFLIGIVTTLLLLRLAQRLIGQDHALKAVALFWFFPASYLLSLAYSEVLMIPAAMACLLALLDRRWLLAGLAAIVVTAARSNGIVIVGCCLWAAFFAIKNDRQWQALIAPVLAPLGFVGFHLYLWYRTGDLMAWFRTEEQAWDERFDFGKQVLVRLWEVASSFPGEVYSTVTTAGLFVAVGGVFLMVRQKMRAELFIFALGMAAFIGGSATIGFRPRFLLSMFPILLAYAAWAKGWRYPAILGTSATLMAGFVILTSTSLEFSP